MKKRVFAVVYHRLHSSILHVASLAIIISRERITKIKMQRVCMQQNRVSSYEVNMLMNMDNALFSDLCSFYLFHADFGYVFYESRDYLHRSHPIGNHTVFYHSVTVFVNSLQNME